MLGGGHSSRIDVHVGINFDGGDFQTGGFEEQAGAGG
jgi:hypothetical protein